MNEIRAMGCAISPAAEGVNVLARTRDDANAVIDRIRAGGGFVERHERGKQHPGRAVYRSHHV